MNDLPILLVGLIFGLQHALDADHIVAVSTMVAGQKKPAKAALVGTVWGIGHTTTLFISGIIVLLFRLSIPENVTLLLEFLVGLMLIVLGIRATLRANKITHQHVHSHNENTHTHYHQFDKHNHNEFNIRSFIIGAIHGLAGSGALMLLVLSSIDSFIKGLIYIFIFGLGSIIGMSIMSVIIGMPSIMLSKITNSYEKYLQIIAGIASIMIGSFLTYKIGFVEGLFF